MGRKAITNHVVVHDTNGVVLGEGTTVSTFKSTSEEPPFIKMYLHHVKLFCQVDNNDMLTLYELLKLMDYSNIIYLNPVQREALVEACGFKTVHSINNSITKLKKANILIPKGRSTFVVNPSYFTKVRWSEVKKIKTTIEYTDAGVYRVTEFVEKDDFANSGEQFEKEGK